MILSFLFYFFICYLLYKLLFDFILPIYRTTRRVRQGFRDMHEQMNGQTDQPSQKASEAVKQPQPDKGDYIDFEEIRE